MILGSKVCDPYWEQWLPPHELPEAKFKGPFNTGDVWACTDPIDGERLVVRVISDTGHAKVLAGTILTNARHQTAWYLTNSFEVDGQFLSQEKMQNRKIQIWFTSSSTSKERTMTKKTKKKSDKRTLDEAIRDKLVQDFLKKLPAEIKRLKAVILKNLHEK